MINTLVRPLVNAITHRYATPQNSETDVVTGAFGYTGKYITRRLLGMGRQAITLTGHPDRPNPFGDQVRAMPFNFDRPIELTRSLEGIDTLYNTYWVRFPYGRASYDLAVKNSEILVNAARKAGVHRIVHISVANASIESPLPYFRGKGRVEQAIIESGISYAILRPTLIFGPEDILINNIAWLLRHFPLFAIPGSGDYELQPIFVEDIAKVAVDAAGQNANAIIDAAGPEVYTFDDMVHLIAATVHSHARLVHLPVRLALMLSEIVGHLVGDVVLTRDEVDGLMANLLISTRPPRGHTSLRYWLNWNAEMVGARYASEVRRHYR